MSVERDQNDGDPIHVMGQAAMRLWEARERGEDISKSLTMLQVCADMYDFAQAALGDRKPPHDLSSIWLQAKCGHNESLFRLLETFKGFAGARWVFDRVRTACERGDFEFLQKYGQALATPPKPRGRRVEWIKGDKMAFIEYVVFAWYPHLADLSTLDIWRRLLDKGLVVGKRTPTSKHLKNFERYLERLGLCRNVAT